MANYVLEILDGDRAGEVVPVGDATLRIGRKPGNDIVLADEKTSGVHCEIAPEDGRLVLRDLGSTNGTFLDGKRVTEIVLTPGDVVTVGRVKVRFGGEDEAGAAGAAGDEFAVRRLDAGRLAKGKSSIGLLLVVLVLLGGGGGYWWWQQGQQQQAGGTRKVRKVEAMVVAGNRLEQSLAACESDTGWRLRAAGVGFRPVGEANTGDGAFAARRGVDGEDGEEGVADADFAVLELAEPIAVFAGRTMTITAHGRTDGAARMLVRAVAFADGEQSPFRFRNGAAFAECADWQPLSCTVTVPIGCDRLQVEVVALLPDRDAEAFVDDVAITEDGEPNGVELRLPDAGQSLLGFGSAVAVRSTDNENPATVLAVEPASVDAGLQQLHAAGLCALSDLGSVLRCTGEGRSLRFAAEGVAGLCLVMPAEAAGGLLVAGEDGAFAAAAAESSFTTRRLLFGSYATRAMLQSDGDVEARGRIGGGEYRLTVSSAQFELLLGFRAEYQQASALLRDARSANDEGRPGAALDELQKLFRTCPMDSQPLAEAQQLRTELLAEQGRRTAALHRDLEEAGFFDTRGGFERVVAGVDDCVALYGEHNFEDFAALQELRAKAEQRLLAMDRKTFRVQRERLTTLGDAFGSTNQKGLQQLVAEYIGRHLPEVADDAEPGETGGDDAAGGR